MNRVITQAWEEFLQPLLKRPPRLQVAALCYRETPDGKDVLMITSRGTGRWILPKGWPMDGKNGAQSALQEAWEEAGVKHAEVLGAPIGSYEYKKRFAHGVQEPVETLVYSAKVMELCTDYPERHQRKRKWMRAEAAANKVREPQLKALLRQL